MYKFSRATTVALFALAVGTTGVNAPAMAYDVNSTSAVNVDAKGVAMHGYDPASFFAAGASAKGNPKFTAKQGGTIFHFASAGQMANAVGFTGSPSDYGMPVTDSQATRTIVIDADTRWVNVTDGETVRFSVDGETFTWHFATFPGQSSFELSKIAPANVRVAGVRAYVMSNPTYRG